MDTSSFIVERKILRDQMEEDRSHLTPASNGKKPALWTTLFSLGMKWGLFPMAQEWAVAGMGRWVYDKVLGSKSRR